MNEMVFFSLFKEACEKCFGNPLSDPLTETDSKILANKIFEKTGLVIGPKSIKNYSFYVLRPKDNRKENPSDATLDTLARYVLDAPYTDEIRRKKNESHFPYWFRYRNKFSSGGVTTPLVHKVERTSKRPFILIIPLVLIILISLILFLPKKRHTDSYIENFNSTSEDSLIKHGWIIKSVDSAWWKKEA